MSYHPFPVGTVRGPYHDRDQTQFLVQGQGGWVPFIRRGANAEKEARASAEEFARKEIEAAGAGK